MRNLKKILCGVMTGLMIVTTAPSAVSNIGFVTEVQAAAIGTPKIISVKAAGKKTVTVKWSTVKGAAGYRIMRKTNNGKWTNLKDITGSKKNTYSDTRVSTGNQYTYTVRAYTKNKKIMSSYNKTGLSAVAGISTLKLSKSTVSVYENTAYTLKISGAKISPKWTSDNTKTATVNSTGKVIGKKAGKAKITAKLGGRSFTCIVTVKKKPVYQVSTAIKNNYAKLIEALNNNGGEFSDSGTNVYGTFKTSITYLASESKIRFSYTDQGEESADLYLTDTKIDQMKVIYTLDGVEYYAALNAPAWKGPDLTFYDAKTHKKGRADTIQMYANLYTIRTFSNVKKVLMANTDLTMKDLGLPDLTR